MKKLLVLLALCMVFSVVLVSCNNNGNEDDTTPEVTTEPTTDPGSESESDDPTTEEPTTEDPTTEDPTTEEPTTEEPTEPPVVVFEGNWHASVDSFMYCVNDDFSDVVAFTAANTNNIIGTTITNGAQETLASVTANYVYFANGWLAADGYELENWAVSIYAEDGTLLKTIDLTLKEAEEGVVNHVSQNMGYGEGTVSHRVGNETEIISLKEFHNQNVTVVYSVGLVGTEFTVDLIKLDVAVPLDPDAPVFMLTPDVIATTANGAPDVANVALSEDGSFVTLTNGEVGDPYVTFRNMNCNSRYIAIKYRTNVEKDFNLFAGSTGSDATGQGDMLAPQLYVADGQWHVVVVDLDPADAVNEEWALSFFRYDFYCSGQNQAIDIAYIAGFNSPEAAQAYFAKTMLVADTTNTFVSDVNGNEAGAKFDAADIGNIMVLRPGTNGWSILEEGGAKLYYMNGIDAVTADMNGAYYFRTNMVAALNNAGVGMVVRGYNSTISSDTNVQFKITNFYETDGSVQNFCGGSGIYAYVNNGTLNLIVKFYDPANGTRVGNKVYRLPAEGTELVMADDGYTVSVMVNGVTYATIDISGSTVYEDITTTPEGAFATKAVVTLKDGTTETIENTLVAATVNSQVGLTCRASQFKLSAIEVGGFSAIEVPALEIVEPEPVDPLAPVAVGDANYLAQVAGSGNQIASAVLSDDGTYVTITSGAGGDPNFFVLPGGSAMAGVQYATLVYRTNIAAGGEFFIGSASITGGADELKFDYVADGEWHVLLLDLTAHSTVVDGLVNYLRYDFYMGGEGQSIDVKEIVLFNSIESYNKYYGIADEEPEDPAPSVEPLVVDLNTEANSAFYNANWPAAGISTSFHKLGYNNFLACGTLDLSQYSKAEIVYSFDGTPGVTDVRVDAALSNAIGLKSEASAYGWYNNEPNFSGDLGHTDYVFSNGGWTAYRTAEIDLSAVDYNGEVWISIYNPEGTEIVIHSLTLIP